MIGYMMLGSKDIKKAAELYDALAAALGGGRMMEFGEHAVMWSAGAGGGICLTEKPFNGEPYSVGNGVMAGIMCPDADKVHELHQIAMDQGCQDEGAPGERSPQFYAAYFRDHDGNKLCAFRANSEAAA